MINIWSGTKGFPAALTNPTELAKKKGNIKQSYPIRYRGEIFKDAEAFYQFMKPELNSNNMDQLLGIMAIVLMCKLEQYPSLYEGIKKRGGIAWLDKCEHTVHLPSRINGGCWEGKGRQSYFIVALMYAYTQQALARVAAAIQKGFDV